ncbi:DUF2271 domain-containing protein [Microbacterium sp. cx-59]|uniref:DUF2271 domain-containing protein n=1 Tax=Microbacterium sp. cx-59 TaxID=2891207 RepID=UPI001E3B4F95|nr:DUF2271 domain-containing protein [Microbacterium sp. cx-59]MCC4908986.1 DUF2271 domain-containing protein [Microbacterium sp. cx-59]
MANKQARDNGKQKTWDEMTPQEKKVGVITLVVLAVVVVIVIAAINGGSKTNVPGDTASSTAETTRTADTPVQEAPKGIAGGNYKVGTDMPAGEYVVVGNGYLQISSDSTGSFESIVENDNYTNRTIITVSSGQYVQFSGRAYTWDEAPKVDTSGATLPAGKYKVGVDLPAGEYKITPTGSSGYLQVASSASDSTDSIISNDNFTSEKYITVANDQYFKFTGATLKLK